MTDVITLTEAAKIASVSRSQVYIWIEIGRLHPIDQNGRQLIERDELQTLLQTEQRQQQEQKP